VAAKKQERPTVPLLDHIPLANSKSFAPDPTRTCERSGVPSRQALFQSEFTIELLNSRITLASATLKSLAVQNPDCTAGVLDHALGL